MLLYCSCISDEKLVDERQCCFLISVILSQSVYQAAAGYFLDNVDPQQSVLQADILSCVLHILFQACEVPFGVLVRLAKPSLNYYRPFGVHGCRANPSF